MGGHPAGRPDRGLVGISRRGRRRTRRAGRTADPRGGQADHAVAQRARRPARPRSTSSSPRPRPHSRDETVSTTADGIARADRARAARRRRQRLGLELPLVRRLQRLRAGAARGQRRALQAVRARDAHRPRDRAPAPRGRRAGRRVHARGRRRRGRRRALRAAASTACSSPARTRTGRRIAAALAPRMVRLQLELGGKDPVYVAGRRRSGSRRGRALADGAMYNTGQSCCAVERIYVHADLHDAFVDAVRRSRAGLRVGDPMDPRHLHRRRSPARRSSTCSTPRSPTPSRRARRVLCGGRRLPGPGNFFAPTVLVDVDHSMALMREESFGPVIGIQKVAGDDEAVALMNDTRYGLTAGVYTRDEAARARTCSARVHAGSAYWNCCDRVSPRLPWSGRGDSGIGLTLSTTASGPSPGPEGLASAGARLTGPPRRSVRRRRRAASAEEILGRRGRGVRNRRYAAIGFAHRRRYDGGCPAAERHGHAVRWTPSPRRPRPPTRPRPSPPRPRRAPRRRSICWPCPAPGSRTRAALRPTTA